VVYSAFRWVTATRTGVFPPRLRAWHARLPLAGGRLAGDLRAALPRGNVIPTPSAVVRRECFQRVGLFSEDLSAFTDWELWLRLAPHYHFAYIPDPLLRVHYLPVSISTDEHGQQRAFERLLALYRPGDRAYREILAQSLFAAGDRRCQAGETPAGRKNFWRAVRMNPGNLIYWVAWLATLFRARGYSRVMRGLGFSYDRR
jgi:hypothetical protein